MMSRIRSQVSHQSPPSIESAHLALAVFDGDAKAALALLDKHPTLLETLAPLQMAVHDRAWSVADALVDYPGLMPDAVAQSGLGAPFELLMGHLREGRVQDPDRARVFNLAHRLLNLGANPLLYMYRQDAQKHPMSPFLSTVRLVRTVVMTRPGIQPVKEHIEAVLALLSHVVRAIGQLSPDSPSLKEDATQASFLVLLSMDFPRMNESQSQGFAVATEKTGLRAQSWPDFLHAFLLTEGLTLPWACRGAGEFPLAQSILQSRTLATVLPAAPVTAPRSPRI
jgi:hypothetical protein